MGQKTNPISNRLGIIRGWDSNWYGGRNFADKIVEDNRIRKYLKTRLEKASVSRVIIERTLKLITVTVNTARPGIIIGKGGQEVDKLREELKNITKQEVQINIFEIKILVHEKVVTFLTEKVSLGSISLSLFNIFLFVGVLYVTFLISIFIKNY